jgi:hypothetical protein
MRNPRFPLEKTLFFPLYLPHFSSACPNPTSQDLHGHSFYPSAVYDEVGCDAQTQAKTGPVMDSAHPCEGKYQACKPEGTHEESELKEPGDKADKEKASHAEIKAPSDNLHVQNNHTLLV